MQQGKIMLIEAVVFWQQGSGIRIFTGPGNSQAAPHQVIEELYS